MQVTKMLPHEHASIHFFVSSWPSIPITSTYQTGLFSNFNGIYSHFVLKHDMTFPLALSALAFLVVCTNISLLII